MDSSLKLKYKKCKLKVKSWEDIFIAEHKRLPDKDDIKKAEPTVRQSYKYYYLLKAKLSSSVENVGDSTLLNEDVTPVTNTQTEAETENSDAEETTKVDLKNSDISDDKGQRDPVLTKVKTSLEAIFSDPIITKPTLKQKREVIPVFSNGGQHLKKLTSRLSALQDKISSSTENDKSPVSNSTDSDKIEAAFKENNKETESTLDEAPSNDETSGYMSKNVKNVWGKHLNRANKVKSSNEVKTLRERTSSFHFTQKMFNSSMKFKNKRNPLKPHVPLRRSKSECFSFFNESSCDSAISQDTNSQTPTASTQEPEGEPEIPALPAATPSSLQLFSSAKCKVTIKDSTQVKATFQTASRLKSDSRHSLDVGWLNRCTKAVESPLVDIFAKEDSQVPPPVVSIPVPKEKVDVQLSSALTPEMCVSQQTNAESFSINFTPHESQQTVNSDVDLFSDDDNEVVSDSDTEKPQKSFLLNRLPKKKSSEDPLPTPVLRKKPKLEENTPTVKTAKQEHLEKKISEGRVNENFVKINIKKKIFVRGRKNTSYSKYKKMMYKKKQTGDGDRGTRIKGGCFTCGESGHWANNCPQKVGLMPLEEAEQLDDSPYLTLEEAGALAEENKPISKFTPLPQPESEETATQESTSNVVHNLPPSNCIMPLYPRPDDDSTLIDTPLEVWQALKQFGHKSFRPGQEEAIMRILSGMSTLVMLSTGAGKSLCYQLPAYLYAKRNECITLVVSPLVSLMEDQVNNLPKPLVGACLHTNQTPKQRAEVEQQLKEGKLHVLLVSPEAVVNSDRMGGLGGLFRFLPPIAFVCIDEAHCVSQWSHNFRPSYLMICKVLRERLKVTTILGLTATATKVTALSIAKSLKVPDDRIISDMPMPENLLLSISRDANRDQALIKLLQGPRFSACESVIIYCIRREECERVAGLLRTCLQDPEKRESSKKRALSWNAEAYHAGLTPFRRKQVQQHFMAGKVRIVVATVAFGMGINKNDLRAVIHYNMPASFERFVQEVGRAGRDGLPAHCHLFLDSKGQDLNELRRHIYSDSVDRHAIRKLLLRVFKPCNCLSAVRVLEKLDPVNSEANVGPSSPEKKSDPVSCPGHEVAFMTEETVQALDLPEENILTLLCYLEHHRNEWVQLLPSAYVLCKVSSYGGSGALKAAAKKCPPLAMAVALDQKAGISYEKSTSIEFKVVDVASAIGWDSGQAKRHLKELEWTKVNDKPQRSKISVQLSGPGLRVRAKGCLPPEDLDEALDWLSKRVESQEKSRLLQLEALFLALTSVSYSTCDECIEDVELERCEKLRESVKEYFNGEEDKDEEPKLLPGVSNEDQIRADVSAMFGTFSDTNFTGRAIARIFHGISSPCYPPYIWGRTKYWRLHLNDNFNSLCQIATKEILRLRS